MAKKIRINSNSDNIENENNFILEHDIQNENIIKDTNTPGVIFIVLSVVLLLSLIIIIIFYHNKTTKLKDENKALSEERDMFKNESERISNDVFNVLGDEYSLDYIKEKLDFYDNNIVFRIEGFGNYYYTYDCVKKKINGTATIWIYDTKEANDNGLRQGTC